MPGYILVAQRDLRPHRPRGMTPYPEMVGFLDFLRDLRQEDLPFPMGARLRVEGLEDVLWAARPNYTPVALHVRDIIKNAANEMNSRVVTVQIVVRDTLERGQNLWAVYRGERLPVHLIFNSPSSQELQGSTVYCASLNLT